MLTGCIKCRKPFSESSLFRPQKVGIFHNDLIVDWWCKRCVRRVIFEEMRLLEDDVERCTRISNEHPLISMHDYKLEKGL